MKTKLIAMSLLTTMMSLFGCSAGAQTQMPQGELLELEFTRSGSMAGFEYFVHVEQTDSSGIMLHAMQETYGQLYQKTLTDEELHGFVQIIEEEQMYAYAPNYEPEYDVLDGYMWTFTARFADRTITSYGNNAMPGGQGLSRLRDYAVQLAAHGVPATEIPE